MLRQLENHRIWSKQHERVHLFIVMYRKKHQLPSLCRLLTTGNIVLLRKKRKERKTNRLSLSYLNRRELNVYLRDRNNFKRLILALYPYQGTRHKCGVKRTHQPPRCTRVADDRKLSEALKAMLTENLFPPRRGFTAILHVKRRRRKKIDTPISLTLRFFSQVLQQRKTPFYAD